MKLGRLLLIVMGVGLLGCDTRSDYDPPDASSPSATVSIAEETWAEQIQAVRRGQSDTIEVTQAAVTDNMAENLSDLTTLRKLSLDQSKLSAASLAQLQAMTKLEHLKLKGNIGDAEIEQIARAKSLRFLNLPQASFTDDALAKLSTLPRLELLRFGSPGVTDAGMQSLPSFPSLRFLHIIDSPITNAGLEPIGDSPQLESFYLDGSQATEEGLGALVLKRRDLHIHINQQHHDRDPRRGSHDH